MMAGRIPSWTRKVIRQQAQTYSAGGPLTVGIRTPRAVGARKTDSVNVSPAPSYLQRFYRAAAHFPAFQGRRRTVVCPCEGVDRALGALEVRPPGAYTPSVPSSALHAVGRIIKSPVPALPVSVPGAAAVYRTAALAPARCCRAKHLDAGDHSVAQLHPELLQEAGAEEPQLGGPGG
jgi:hypothetical protein